MFGSIFDRMNNHNDFIKSVNNGDVEMVNDLIRSQNCDPTINENEGISIAIEKEDMAMIELLLRNNDVLSTVDWDYLLEISKKDYIKKYILKKKYMLGYK